MKVELYTASVGVFVRGLDGLSAILRKGEAYAAANRLKESDILHARLFSDMFPLYRQVEIVCDFAGQVPARLSGLEVPPDLAGNTDFARLHTRISEKKQFLNGLSPSQFEGRDELSIDFPVGEESMTLPASQYLLNFAIQNYFFHFVTAYAILRTLGVELGKRDYFGV